MKALGSRKYTVLAYHHQWLYGLTFPALIHQLLEFYQSEEKADKYDNHPRNMEWFLRDLGIGFADPNTVIQRFVDFHTFLLSIYTHPWEGTRNKALEGFRFLNLDEPDMREHFDYGDNNDGVCIVDPLEGAYAFLNIHNPLTSEELEEYQWGVYGIEPYTPTSAADYVKAYYPVDPLKVSPDEAKRMDAVLAENTKKVNLTDQKYQPYRLLAMEEIIKIFPRMKAQLTAEK